MPGTVAAIAAEQAYAVGLDAIRRRIATELARLTINLTSDDLDSEIEAFAPIGAALLTGGQLEAQQAAADFVTNYLAAEGIVATPAPVDRAIAGFNSIGRPLLTVIGASLATGIFTMLRSGHPPAAALEYAAHAVTRLSDAELTGAADREIAHQGEDNDRVAGWRWVLTGAENCAACLAQADGRVREMDERFPRHPHCDCLRSIRLVNDPEVVDQPTGAELFARMTPVQQARQFRTAGEEKAELVRSGKLSLSDMVAVERHANWRAIVTEKSLAEVVPS